MHPLDTAEAVSILNGARRNRLGLVLASDGATTLRAQLWAALNA